MPRRSTYKILAKETDCYDVLVSELQKIPALSEYDMETIEISVKKKFTPHIRDIDRAILNLKHYYAANKHLIQTIDGKQLVFKKDLSKMLKVSRPTLDKWLKYGFITPSQIFGTSIDCFQIDEVIAQLDKQKQ